MKKKEKERKEDELSENVVERKEDAVIPMENGYPNYVGKTAYVGAAGFKGKIIAQRALTKNKNGDTMLIVEFDNKYCCNSEIITLEEK